MTRLSVFVGILRGAPQRQNNPSLYFESEETFITDLNASSASMKITGSLLGAVRAVKEIDILRDAIKDVNDDIPVVGLMDGTLIMLDLIRAGFPDYVVRQILQGGFLSAMSDIRDLPKDKPERKRRLKEIASHYTDKKVTLYNADAILITMYGLYDKQTPANLAKENL